MQHRFLTWLKYQTHTAGTTGNYESLLAFFQCTSIRSRFAQADVTFVRSVFSGRLNCSNLVAMFPLSAPSRRLRRPVVLHVPHGRVNSVRRGFLVRLPQQVDSLVYAIPQFDLFSSSFNLRSDIAKFADRCGKYLS